MADDLAGEPGADRDRSFDALFLERWDRMARRAFLVVGDVAAAEEVVQDAFAEVYRRWDDIERHDAYLARSVTTGAIRRGRRQRREPPTAPVDRPVLADPEAAVDDRLVVDGLLRRLSPKARAIIVLRFYDGLSEAEIADQVGCRPGTVGPTITRALRSMAEGARA